MKNIAKYLTIFSAFNLIFLLAGCTSSGEKEKMEIKEKAKKEIINTDKEFYNVSKKIGTGNAFIQFADENTTLMKDGQLPIIGKADLIKSYNGKEGNLTPLEWDPVKAEVSDDGTLGFTFGNWKYAYKNKEGKDTTLYGVYVTIWKKQKDNTWKYIFDGGNETPPPPGKMN